MLPVLPFARFNEKVREEKQLTELDVFRFISLAKCNLLPMCRHIPSSSSKGYSSPSFAQPFPAEPLLVFSLFHREYMCVVSGITTLQPVSIHFSQEEWEHLDSAQMNLQKEVMLENFSHLVSVGKDIYPLKFRLCPWESLPSPLKIIKLTS